MAEYWAGMGGDGHRRKSQPTPLPSVLRVLWSHDLSHQPPQPFYTGAPTQRAQNLAIRSGRVLAMDGQVQLFHLYTGNLIASFPDPGIGAGGQTSPAGQMMSDCQNGYFLWYWQQGDIVFTGSGGDASRFMVFSSASGALLEVAKAPQTPLPGVGKWMEGNANQSGYFAMTNGRPTFASGGNSSDFEAPNCEGALNLGETRWPAMAFYGACLVDGDWIYNFRLLNGEQQFSGVTISGHNVVTGQEWNYEDSGTGFLSWGLGPCAGALRAICLGDDGLLYYYGPYVTGGWIDPVKGMALVGVDAVSGRAELEVSLDIGPDYRMQVNSTAGYPPGDPWIAMYQHSVNRQTYAQLVPQIAQRGRYVVVFQPQQTDQSGNSQPNAHLFCIDTVAKTLAWRYDWPAGAFQVDTSTNGGSGWSPERAVQLLILGTDVLILEPQNLGTLTLSLQRFALATGVRTVSTFPVPSISLSPNARVALNDFGGADGVAIALVAIETTRQAIVAIGGSSGPELLSAIHTDLGIIAATVAHLHG